jgi:hypothetical protein
VARTLRPGGHCFLYEMHPILEIFGTHPKEPGFDPAQTDKALYAYFETAPWIESDGLDYYSGTPYAGETTIAFRHRLGEIVTAAAQAGLTLLELEEHPHDISNLFGELAARRRFPACFTLVALRP